MFDLDNIFIGLILMNLFGFSITCTNSRNNAYAWQRPNQAHLYFEIYADNESLMK